jgi:hypothetical protein
VQYSYYCVYNFERGLGIDNLLGCGSCRFLETEVHRLKSALVAERKLRSLQLEAIRSLWSQVQKVSSLSSSSPAGRGGDIMSQSMPNGLPTGDEHQTAPTMAMSFHGGMDRKQSLGPLKEQNETESTTVCECTKEIKHLRESLTDEMAQLRKMIDQLKLGSNGKTVAEPETESTDELRISQQKRPLTLNLVGISSKDASSVNKSGDSGQESKEGDGSDEKKEIAGYANQIASSILEGAVEKDEEAKEKE